MDRLTQQVVALTDKVDSLSEMIKQLTKQVSEHLSQDESTELVKVTPSLLEYGFSASPKTRQSTSVQEHKDILLDDEYVETSYYNREPTLTADIQIQRLTAQLTAAYNRIAALEEQLLSKRTHF